MLHAVLPTRTIGPKVKVQLVMAADQLRVRKEDKVAGVTHPPRFRKVKGRMEMLRAPPRVISGTGMKRVLPGSAARIIGLRGQHAHLEVAHAGKQAQTPGTMDKKTNMTNLTAIHGVRRRTGNTKKMVGATKANGAGIRGAAVGEGKVGRTTGLNLPSVQSMGRGGPGISWWRMTRASGFAGPGLNV